MTATKGCFLSAAAAVLVLLTLRALRPTPPEEVVKSFPVGSRLVDLDPYLKKTNLEPFPKSEIQNPKSKIANPPLTFP